MREASSCTSRSASSRASDPTPAVSPPSSSRSSCQRSRVCCPTPSAASGPGHPAAESAAAKRSEEHTSELQSRGHLVCRLLLEKKKNAHQSLGLGRSGVLVRDLPHVHR